MTFLFVRHTVRDFDHWRPIYDAHRSTRQAAGLADRHLLRSADNPNDVTLLFEVADVGKAEAFVASQDLRDTMARAGVISQPEIRYLHSA